MKFHNSHHSSALKKPSSWAGIIFVLCMGMEYDVMIGGGILVKSEMEGIIQILSLVLVIVWPLLYFIFSHHNFFPQKILGATFLALFVFFLFCFLSSFMSPIAIHSISFVGLTLISFWIALQFASCMDGLQFEMGLKIYSILIIAVLLAFAVYDYVPSTRLGNGKGIINPNSIGMVAISAALATMAFRNWLIRYTLMGAAFLIIYLSGSRSSAIGTLIGLMVIGYERTRSSGRGMKVLVVFMAVVTLVSIAVYWDGIISGMEGFLQLHTKDRGIDSGATGRTTVWRATWELFLDNPVFGIGFRAHENILGGSSHNGYLATLAEIGLIGFIAMLYLLVSGTFLLWRRVRQSSWTFSHSILLGTCIANLFLAVFERFLINIGNPTSLLFLVAILSSVLASPSKEKFNTKNTSIKPLVIM